MNCLEYIITHISPTLIIHRISGDAPKDLLVAPEWNLHKKKILNGLDKILKEKKFIPRNVFLDLTIIYYNDIVLDTR